MKALLIIAAFLLCSPKGQAQKYIHCELKDVLSFSDSLNIFMDFIGHWQESNSPKEYPKITSKYQHGSEAGILVAYYLLNDSQSGSVGDGEHFIPMHVTRKTLKNQHNPKWFEFTGFTRERNYYKIGLVLKQEIDHQETSLYQFSYRIYYLDESEPWQFKREKIRKIRTRQQR